MIKTDMTIKITNNSLKRKYNKEIGEEIKIETKSLSKGSHTLVECICDMCGQNKQMMYKTYYKLINNDLEHKYYCHKCSHEKTKSTNKKKYGVEYACQNKEIFNKVRQTNKERYGVEIVSQLEKFEIKKKETNKKKYGVEHPQQNKIIKEKSIKKMIEKYGVKTPIQNTEIKEKIKQTNKIKYGSENASSNKKNRNKITNTVNKKTKEKYKKIINILNITNEYYECLCEKQHIFKIEKSLLNQRLKYGVCLCTICNPINMQNSDAENKLLNFIKENYSGTIIENSRNIINPYELDIYLPDLNISFEFNGLYWHSEKYKNNNYHYDKTEKCLDKNIQLIHIWEDDWNFKSQIVKSIILNKLGKTPKKVY